MEISISNIAWDINIDKKIISILKRKNVRYIDIAPTKYFQNIRDIPERDVLKIKDYWNNEGISFYGMQSLLFGVQDLNIFSSEKDQKYILEYLEKIFKIGNLLGTSKVVFGSPKNRDKKNLDDKIAFQVATNFFRKLSDLGEIFGQIICLEPNPTEYGCNFMTSTSEAAKVVKAVNRKAIRLQLDTGTILVNNEDIELICQKFKDLISHIHLSQPGLLPVYLDGSSHINIARTIKNNFEDQVVTIEMLTKNSKDPIIDISKSIDIIKELY